MELRQLEYLSAVAGDGTYTAAAKRLHVAQPALWKQVHELERELGVALFEKVGRRVRLTRAGTLMLERCNELLVNAAQLRLLADELRLGHRGTIRVGCFAPHVVALLAQVIARFRTAHPDIAVQLTEHSQIPSRTGDAGTLLVDSLREGAVDVITSPHLAGDADLEGFAVYEVRVAALPAPQHMRTLMRRGRTGLPVSALTGVPLVVSPRGYLSRKLLETAARSAGVDLRIEAEISSPAALVALAARGIGTAIVADDGVPPGGALTLSHDGRLLSDSVWLYRRRQSRDPAVEAFCDTARSLKAAGR